MNKGLRPARLALLTRPGQAKESKLFFFAKKNQKTLGNLGRRRGTVLDRRTGI
jgi:hypothetical protein